MKKNSHVLFLCAAALLFLATPAVAVAYGQGYYEGYYQGYYQTYYQPYYQGYYQGAYQASYTGASSTAIYLTSGTSWTVPSDWTSVNTIEVIGGGGGGASGAGFAGGGGGGGGGYSKISNRTLTPGASITYSIGAGGAGGVGVSAAGGNGSPTYFNGTTCILSSVCAWGGNGGVLAGSGAIGAEGVGTTKYYGGYSPPVVDTRGTGGGGAAGPNGAGINGSATTTTTGGSGGGGYGGVGATANTNGSNGTEFSASYGSGGGGGGGTGQRAGGAGGTYGGGGGGGAGGGFSGGTGGSGLIVIQYTVSASTPATGDSGTTGDVNITVDTKIKGNLFVTGALSKGAGTFVIDHPLYPRTKLLYHSFVESPQASNLYDGIATLDANGEATVVLPKYFEALNKDFRYQFLALKGAMPKLYIKEEIKDNHFTIAGGKSGGKVSWQVTGTRKDAYILKHPIVPEVPKTDKTVVKKGFCLFEPLCK